MNKRGFLGIGLILFLLIASFTYFYLFKYSSDSEEKKTEIFDKDKEKIVDCSSLSVDERDSCCEKNNEDLIHVECLGSWKFLEETEECKFVCDSQ